jgi:hypothetical protein
VSAGLEDQFAELQNYVEHAGLSGDDLSSLKP